MNGVEPRRHRRERHTGASALRHAVRPVVARGPYLDEAVVALRAQTIAGERAWRPVFAGPRPEVYRLDAAEGRR
jgi:hypothetical protein